jgi:predicted dehydrogenase
MTRPTDSSRRDFLKTAGSTLIASSVIGALPSLARAQEQQAANAQTPNPSGKKTGWAIMGLGRLALGQIMPAFAQAQMSAPVALVSGHPDKARDVAQKYGIDPKNIYSYDNYDSIKDNPAIEVVYNVLPDSMHAEYTIRGLKAGKHVLCEKPMCRSVAEAQQMIDASKQTNRKLMIAYRLHYEPYNLAAIELCRTKACGDLRLIEAENVQNTRPPNIRLSKETGTGPLGDVGVYCINATRYLTGEEPVEATGMNFQMSGDPRATDFPDRYAFLLRFPSGVIAHCACGFSGGNSKRYRVACENGWIDMESAYGYAGQKLRVSKQNKIDDIQLAPKNHFAAEMDHFSDCVQNDKQPQTPGEEGLADMKVMAAVLKACQTGQVAKI